MIRRTFTKSLLGLLGLPGLPKLPEKPILYPESVYIPNGPLTIEWLKAYRDEIIRRDPHMDRMNLQLEFVSLKAAQDFCDKYDCSLIDGEVIPNRDVFGPITLDTNSHRSKFHPITTNY